MCRPTILCSVIRTLFWNRLENICSREAVAPTCTFDLYPEGQFARCGFTEKPHVYGAAQESSTNLS